MVKDKKGIQEDIYTMYLTKCIKNGTEDIKNGRVMSIEESIKRMKKKHDSFNI